MQCTVLTRDYQVRTAQRVLPRVQFHTQLTHICLKSLHIKAITVKVTPAHQVSLENTQIPAFSLSSPLGPIGNFPISYMLFRHTNFVTVKVPITVKVTPAHQVSLENTQIRAFSLSSPLGPIGNFPISYMLCKQCLKHQLCYSKSDTRAS